MLVVLVLTSFLLAPPALANDGEEPLCKNDVAKECRCVREDGSVLDLNDAASKNASAPRFSSYNDNGEVIQFNPCFGFRCGKDATTADSAVCDTNDLAQYNVQLGVQSSLQIETIDDNTVASYSNGKFQVFITLVCSNMEDFGTFRARERNGSRQMIYDGSLLSRHSCFSQPFVPAPDADYFSTGDALLIFLFGSVGGYLVIGSAVQIFVKKQSGWAVIPNHTVWLALPGLILDGMNFAFCGVCASVRGSYGDI